MKKPMVILSAIILITSCGEKDHKESSGLTAFDSKNDLETEIHKVDHKGTTTLYSKVFRGGELIDSSKWKLPCEVVKMQVGDIDENGVDDLFVIPVKTTRYDSIVRKRPFFFRLHKGHIVPMWLGSRLSRPMVDAHMVSAEEGTRLRSIEVDTAGYLVADYKWKGFGLQFDHYLSRSTDLFSALNQLYSRSNTIVK